MSRLHHSSIELASSVPLEEGVDPDDITLLHDGVVGGGRWNISRVKYWARDHPSLCALFVGVPVAVAIIFGVILIPIYLNPANHPINHTVVLISYDGFRWDYYTNYTTPNLHRLAATGASAPLSPVFPSKTFPNHYTLITGLYPSSHGIVANTFYDPQFDATFRISDASATSDGRWWGGEPLWVTAELQGQLAATYFWPGSEAEIKGKRPTYWYPYNEHKSNNARVDQVFDWLALPQDKRPTFITLYFSLVDTAGHKFGPTSPETRTSVEDADILLGRLLDGLDSRPKWKSNVTVIVVSDHGMASISTSRVIYIDDYIDMGTVTVTDWSPVLGLWPQDANATYSALVNAHPRLHMYYRDEIPARYHYRHNDRIPPIIGIADVGWSIGTHSSAPAYFTGGAHGYDNEASAMQGVLVAGGPHVKDVSESTSRVANTDIYNLVCGFLKLDAAVNNGTDSLMPLVK